MSEAKTEDEKIHVKAVRGCWFVLDSHLQLEEMWGKQLRHGYVIAVEKLMKTLHYSPKVPGMPKEDLARMKEVMKQQIIRQHIQTFSAAGKSPSKILLHPPVTVSDGS